MPRKIFYNHTNTEDFCRELTYDRIPWQLTVFFDQPHFDENSNEIEVYDDFVVDYIDKTEIGENE